MSDVYIRICAECEISIIIPVLLADKPIIRGIGQRSGCSIANTARIRILIGSRYVSPSTFISGCYDNVMPTAVSQRSSSREEVIAKNYLHRVGGQSQIELRASIDTAR